MTSDLAGLYVHVPFCSVKCYYCDFTAFAHQHSRTVSRYLDALRRESERNLTLKPATVYIGGGTPSELSAEQIGELFSFLPRCAESTFECNVESVTPEKLDALKRAGVTRLSFGLQTHEDSLLKAIGRRHTAQHFLDVYRQAVGRFATSIDLMYGLPGQSLESFRGSLDFVLALDPGHISVYGLQVEDKTLFARRNVAPDEDLGRSMFELCLERLAAAGYRHYEISNWAKPGLESRHNLNYWRNGEYVGLGCGAASYVDGVRRENPDRLADYFDGKAPESESLSGKQKLGESLMLGLRLVEGFAPAGPMWQAFEGEIAALERRGLLERRGALLRLTREGIFLANDVFREFVAPYAVEAVIA